MNIRKSFNLEVSKVDASIECSTLIEILSWRAFHQQDRNAYTFLVDGETQEVHLTYKELEQQAKAIASTLQSQGTIGERALLLYPPGLEFISAFFGCLYAGFVAVPAYPPRPNQSMSRLQAIVADAQATVVLTTTSVLANVERQLAQNPALANLHWVATDTIPREQASDWQEFPVISDSLAFLQYTSGSTGTPKGVMVSHGNLLHNEQMIKTAFGHTEKTIFVGWLPLFHDMGLVGNVLQPIYLGIPCIFMSPLAFLQKPLRWLQTISRYKATTSGGPNFAYDMCFRKITPEQREDLDLSSWEVAFNGAEPVRAETLESFARTFAPCGFRREAFYPCYGMAETTLIVSGGLKTATPVICSVKGAALEKNRVVVTTNKQEDVRKIVGCGRSWLDQKIVIVNPETLTSCPSEQVGEVWVSSLSVAQGYWNRPEETEQTFNAYLVDTRDGPFLRTGDLGFVQDGELFITGRLKDVIIIRGRNHYPQDIELTVEESHPALRSGCSAAFSVEVDGVERLVVAQEVERSYIRRLDINEVIGAIRQVVAEQHEIQVYAVLLLKTSSIPKTSSGKIQRHACRSGFLAGSLDLVGDWTENPRSKAEFLHLETELECLTRQLQTPKQQFSDDNDSKDGSRTLKFVPTEEAIQAWLLSHLGVYLKVPSDEIDIREPLARYGLDSSVAVSTTGELAKWLGRELESTLFWEYPSIEALVQHLAKETYLLQSATQISH